MFDLDGTLVDSRRTIDLAVRDAWMSVGLEPPGYERTRRIVGLSLDDAVRELAPELPAPRYRELGEAYKEAFLKNRSDGHEEPLYVGALETVRALKQQGWLLGIATGKSHRGVRHFLEHYGARDLFDAAFCAEDGPGKPDPHMLHLNMRTLDADPERTIMIGDTSHDMKMARTAQCYAAGVSWGFHTEAEIRAGGAHEVVDTFEALASLLAQRE